MLAIAPTLCLDFGTDRTRVGLNGAKAAYDEPTILAVDDRTDTIVAAGQAALERYGRAAPNIQFLFPVRGGAVADYAAALYFLKSIFRKVLGRGNLQKPTVIAAAPAETTSVEERALADVIREAGARDIYIVPAPLAAHLARSEGDGTRTGSLIADIGGGTTDIAILSADEVLYGQTVRMGGRDMAEMISRFLEVSYRVRPGRFGAEEALKRIGIAAYGEDEMLVQRRTATRDFPAEEVQAPLAEIVAFLRRGLQPALDGFLTALEKAPPEVCADVYLQGALLTGGGALIPGMAEWIGSALNLEVRVARDPANAAIDGLNRMHKNRRLYFG